MKTSLPTTEAEVSSGTSSKDVILEKTSIDEFFLDITGLCDNPQHPLWERVKLQQQEQISETEQQQVPDENSSNSNDAGQPKRHKTIVVGI